MDENYQRYLELIENFYQSKNNYLSGVDKKAKCDGCDTDKIYTETQKEIVLSCGDKGKCGKKIEIILPKYIYKEKEIDLLKSELEKVINWDVVNQYIKVESSFLEDNRELIEGNNKKIQEIKNKYYDIYQKNNARIINDKYKEILKLKEENEDIKIKLGDISIQNDMKKEMRKSYIEKLEKINILYSDIKENMTNIKEYYIDEEPIIKIDKLDIVHVTNKKVKKTKVSIKDFDVGMKVSFMSKGNKYVGTIMNTESGSKDKVEIKVNKKNVKVSINKLTIIGKKEPDKKEPDKKEPGKKEPIKNINDFKDGLIVKFSSKGNEYQGEVIGRDEENNRVKVKVGNKEPMVSIKKLTIVSEIPEPQKEVVKDSPIEDEPVEDKPVSSEIEIGSKVKWTSKSGEELNGIVEKITKQSYKICCRPGKVSGEKGAVYLVEKTQVSLE